MVVCLCYELLLLYTVSNIDWGNTIYMMVIDQICSLIEEFAKSSSILKLGSSVGV